MIKPRRIAPGIYLNTLSPALRKLIKEPNPLERPLEIKGKKSAATYHRTQKEIKGKLKKVIEQKLRIGLGETKIYYFDAKTGKKLK